MVRSDSALQSIEPFCESQNYKIFLGNIRSSSEGNFTNDAALFGIG